VRGAELRLDPDRLERAFTLAERHVAEGVTGYAALAVGTSAGPVRVEAFDRSGRLETAPSSPIASITKPITAVAVLQLVESGDLVLLEPVSTYVPAFRPTDAGNDDAGEPIMAWHLLTHTSGLADLEPAWYAAAPRTPADVVAALAEARPDFRPGTAFRYTTDTYQVLAAMIAGASGLPYETYLGERLFGPLGMTGTGFDPDRLGQSVEMVDWYGHPGMPPADARAAFRRLAMPGGGLWSTPDDLLRFGRAMLGGGTVDGVRVLGRPFLDLMLRRHTARVAEIGTGRAPNYGLGWGFPGLGYGTPSSEGSFGHAGGTGSVLLVDPAYDLVIVHLRNRWGATMKATDEVVQAVYGALDGPWDIHGGPGPPGHEAIGQGRSRIEALETER
jgi:CubicO group peptidase (beta-lactamase class C family)